MSGVSASNKKYTSFLVPAGTLQINTIFYYGAANFVGDLRNNKKYTLLFVPAGTFLINIIFYSYKKAQKA